MCRFSAPLRRVALQPERRTHVCTALLPNHLRPRREKVFGDARGIPLDRNAKARIKVYVPRLQRRHRAPGQHHGPITRAYLDVFEALLWGFHNAGTVAAFPATRASPTRRAAAATVYEAINALEAADILSWANRIVRELVRECDLFGQWAQRWRTIRTSNAYVFRDSVALCCEGRGASKCENPSGTLIPRDFPLRRSKAPAPADTLTGMDNGLLTSPAQPRNQQ